jgi:hypothetical protein
MKLTTNTILIILGLLALMIMACIPMTLLALPVITSNQIFAVEPTATIPVMVPPTVIPATNTAVPTSTLTPTAIPPTTTPVPTATQITYCDWVMFVKDVTIPDATVFAPGETFVKTWRLKNRGTCTWSPDYMLVFNNGAQMGSTTAVRLPSYVAPGQTVDVSVTLTAPAAAGHYTGYWILRNPSGALFGFGDKADKAFYVDIYSQDVLPHGTVTGNICYPSEFNPEMTVYFERVGGETIQFYVPENHMTFSFLLPNGTYYAYAWAPNYNLEGAYVNTDRTMKTFVINGGQTTSGIGICDWDPHPHSRGQ